MRLGDLLIRAKRVTEDDVARALERINEHGGRLGDNLVAIGAIDQQTLESYLHRIPAEPADIAATGIDETDLIGPADEADLLGRLKSVRQFIDAIKLPVSHRERTGAHGRRPPVAAHPGHAPRPTTPST